MVRFNALPFCRVVEFPGWCYYIWLGKFFEERMSFVFQDAGPGNLCLLPCIFHQRRVGESQACRGVKPQSEWPEKLMPRNRFVVTACRSITTLIFWLHWGKSTPFPFDTKHPPEHFSNDVYTIVSCITPSFGNIWCGALSPERLSITCFPDFWVDDI